MTRDGDASESDLLSSFPMVMVAELALGLRITAGSVLVSCTENISSLSSTASSEMEILEHCRVVPCRNVKSAGVG